MFRKICCVAGMLLAGFFASGQSAIVREGNSQAEKFDDNWRFARFGLQPEGTRLEEPAGIEAFDYADNSWQPLTLPHDWAIAGPFRIELSGKTGKLPWKGIGWYRKDFTLPLTDTDKRIFLDFDGAMAYAKIWVNGQYVGTWPYGYSSFRMDITPYIHAGKKNVVAVRLDTENWDSRWYPGAGIYRHVWLVKTNAVHVSHWGTYITTADTTGGNANVSLKVNVANNGNASTKAFVQTAIYESADGKKIGKKIATGSNLPLQLNANDSMDVASSILIRQPQRWTLEHPHLYIAQTIVTDDKGTRDVFNTVFGIRKIEFTAHNGFLLNGKRVEFKGVCLHHDMGSIGAAINNTALRRQLTILKSMGCNAIRTSHNPPAPELLALADEMGFLVWDEAFDVWLHKKLKNDYNKLFNEWHERDLQALVHRDRNHPSVVIWSVGNEVMDQRDTAMTKMLADIVKKEDPTRPVSNAYNDPDGGRESGAATALGLMGVNYFFGRQAEWDKDPRYQDMPTIGSETSSCVSSRGEYFFHNQKFNNWQVSSYDNAWPGWGCSPDTQFRILHKNPRLLGEFVWTGFDYLGEPTPFNSDETNLLNFRTDTSKRKELQQALEELQKKNPPSRSSYFGILDLCGFPKDRFYSYQAQWRPEMPMAHLLPHWNWPERVDSIVPVQVYTSGDQAELFLNGKSQGIRKKRAGEDFRMVWDSVKYAPGVIHVVTYKNGKIWANDTIRTTGKAEKIMLKPETRSIKADGEDLCYITVQVSDAKGNMVPRSNPALTFQLEGPGEIVATDNGDATSLISFKSLTRPAYNGLAQVIVKAAKNASGQLKVKVSSADGIAGAAVVIPINH
ncbi:beta-galactosidase GalB [Chitinophaga sp. Cy-1792]|uniref:beta-galactosidase GalB n=1 Tax=Chitinophaga sp. Cy-1792 TaxID=2608339 RepID=UPI001965A246|nr:beta-galactosidase GalB [Chitinophaga sp. Cy-1792]NIG54062.1 DUF4982 domain-containing protein [Chitinophaga sp. Cy-1792]